MQKKLQLNNNTLLFNENSSTPDCKITYEYEVDKSKICVNITLENIGSIDYYPGNFKVFENVEISHPLGYDKTYIDCKDMLGWCGPQYFDRHWTSHSVCGLLDSNHFESILMGFDDLRNYFYNFQVEKVSGEIFIVPICPFEKTYLKPGEILNLSKLIIIDEDSLQKDFDEYSKIISGKMGEFDRSKKLPTGYCTWYYHYGTEKSSDIYKITDNLALSPLKDSLEYILIDDGWNNTLEAKKSNWGDWDTKSKYPEGMKNVAGYIHNKGFKAGLWLAPFCVTNNSEVFKNNPDWILGLGEDLLNNGGEVYGLDLTHPGVQNFLKETFNKVFYTWEFDFIKIDFLVYGALETNKRYNPALTSVQAFRKGIEIIRDCAGPEKMILQCGSPLLQSVGCCDSMRIGPDVGSQWFFPLNEHMWQYGNCSIKPAMRYTIYHHWMHNNLWYNDPDCIVGRSRSNGIEFTEFKKWFPQVVNDENKFGLTENEMLAWSKLIWITGGARLLSDELDEMEEKRRQFIIELFESEPEETILVDYYKYFDIAIFKTRNDASKIAIFNISDEIKEVSLPSNILGIVEWKYDEITENISIEGSGDIFKFPLIPPRTGYIFCSKE